MRYGFWVIAGLVLVLDQLTKLWVLRYLPFQEQRPWIPHLVYLQHTHNTGMAFGQLQGAGRLLILVVCVAAACILIYRARLLRRGEGAHPLLVVGLAFPMGGAIGNAIDRVRFGYVIDFIDLRWFPIFNVADSAITVGALALACYFALGQQGPERERERLPQAVEAGREPGI